AIMTVPAATGAMRAVTAMRRRSLGKIGPSGEVCSGLTVDFGPVRTGVIAGPVYVGHRPVAAAQARCVSVQ
ncbi:hypothetical protein, partial [Actinoplanes flavus]